jgi:membrane-associated phospholipid phosphatase
MHEAELTLRIKRLWILAAALAVSALLALLVDVPLARLFAAGRFPGELRHLVRLSEVYAHGSGVVLLLLAAAALDPRGWRIVPRLALAAFGAGLLADAMKLVLARYRPSAFDLDLNVWHSFLGFFAWRHAETFAEAFSRNIQSFASGHAATAAGLACAMSRLYPRGTWFFVLMAVLASFQRLEAGAHFFSDVLAGASLGVVFNLLLEHRLARSRLEDLEQGG